MFAGALDTVHRLANVVLGTAALIIAARIARAILGRSEVARRLRQSPRTREVPIIAVSALARAQEREAAVHAGCDAYIAKPFTPEEMARVIAGTLGRQGAVA
jgi:CheY-like chemotaxis protein